MVVSGPGIAKRGFVNSRAQVADIAPTLMEAAGVPYGANDFHGRSLLPLLEGDEEQAYGENDAFAFETSGAAALYRGKWKITRTLQPYGDDAWHLYDISVDPGETTDVSAQHPELFEEMRSEYAAYAERVGVFEMPPGESARKQLSINALEKIAKNYWHLLLAFAAVALGVLYGFVRGAQIAFRKLRAARRQAA
jgi:arylsulfatase/uncharacterized sulfatase